MNLGMRVISSWSWLRACEVGTMKESPRWMGYEGDGRRASGHEARQGSGAEKTKEQTPQGRWQQLVYALTYFFAWRLNLGWSDSLATPEFVPPYRHERRGTLVARHSIRAAVYYVAWDVCLGMLEAAPTFRTWERRAGGSVWEPIVWEVVGGKVVLPPVVSAVYMTLV